MSTHLSSLDGSLLSPSPPGSSPPNSPSPSLARTPRPSSANRPRTTPRTWDWLLDEASIRDDGGVGDLSPGLDPIVLQRVAYHPPDAAYQRVLRGVELQDGPEHAGLSSSGGWITPLSTQDAPVLVAHSLLAAIWVIRESLPDDAVPNRVWEQLTLAVASPAVVEDVHLAVALPAVVEDVHLAVALPAVVEDVHLAVALPAVVEDVHREPASKRQRVAVHSERNQPQTTTQERARGRATTSVTNNNRKAERRREAARALKEQRQIEDLGLVKPHPAAPAAEREAHRSITPVDAPTISWIIKQPAEEADFFTLARLPYADARTMLQCARALGNDIAKEHAMYFVHNWRRSGNPLLFGGHAASSLARSAATQVEPAHSSFELEWNAITASEAITATAGVVYRWGMASLGRRYQRKIESLKAAASTPEMALAYERNDHTLRTRAKKAIWDETRPPTSWAAFNARLKRSRRWYQAAQTLGWGLLLLVPADTVTHNWVEQTMRGFMWDIWLKLVPRVNPDAVAASRSFDNWLGVDRLENASLDDAPRLLIEVPPPERLVEIADSEDEEERGNEADGSEEENPSSYPSSGNLGVVTRVGVAGSQIVPTQPIPAFVQAVPLRELFQLLPLT